MTQLIVIAVLSVTFVLTQAKPQHARQKYQEARLPGLAVFQLPARWKVSNSQDASSSPDLERIKRTSRSGAMPYVFAYSEDGGSYEVKVYTLPYVSGPGADDMETRASTSTYAPAAVLGLRIRRLSVRAVKLNGGDGYLGAFDITSTLPHTWNSSEYRFETRRGWYAVTVSIVANGPGPFRDLDSKVADVWRRIAASWKWQDGKPAAAAK